VDGGIDAICHQIPADATWLLAWSGGFGRVPGYRTPDCSGDPYELNSFHTWPEGYVLTYRAS
jgi:hypothetical protein